MITRRCLSMALISLLLSFSCSIRSRGTVDPGGKVDQLNTRTETSAVEEGSASNQLVPPTYTYRLQAFDRLKVHFPFGSDLDFEAVVRPDGYITSPLFGDVRAENLSSEDLAKMLTTKYADKLVKSEAVVIVTEFTKQHYYVFGEVGNPARYDYDRGLDLISALTMAGGTGRGANLKKVVVVRVLGDSTYTFNSFNIEGMLDGGTQRPIWIGPNDIVIVPTSTITDIGIWVDQYIKTFLPPIDTFLRGRYYWFYTKDVIAGQNQ